jgi:hypothetical protein
LRDKYKYILTFTRKDKCFTQFYSNSLLAKVIGRIYKKEGFKVEVIKWGK